MSPLYLRLFGGARLEADGALVRGRAAHRRRLALLALLASAPNGRGVGRERLVGLLWPDSSPDAARRLLSESLYVIRKELGENAIIAAGDELILDSTVVPSDVADFRRAVANDALERAVAVYSGPFLDGWFVDDAAEFERWATRERDELARSFANCLQTLAERCEAREDWTRAVAWWRALSDTDPFSSRAALRLAQAQSAAGERAAALQTLAVHEALLREELEVAPDDELLAFARQLRAAPERSSVVRRAEPPKPDRPSAVPPPRDTAPARSPTPLPLETRPSRRWLTFALPVAAVGLSLALVVLRPFGDEDRDGSRFFPRFDEHDIAILPFKDLSGRNAALAYGLTDELIARFTNVAPIRVAARSAVMGLSQATVGMDSIARALRVGTLVDGTVQEAGGRVVVRALITNVADGRQLAAARAEGPTGDYFGLLDALAAELEREFRRVLGDDIRRKELTRGTRRQDAARFMAEAQRAIDLARLTGREWRADAVELSRTYMRAADSVLQLAAAADPRWPQPLVKRALVASLLASTQHDTVAAGTLASGIALLDRALALDPGNASALELRGKLRFQRVLTYQTRDASRREVNQAIADYESAKSRDALRVGAWIGRAFIAWFTKDTVVARVNLEGAERRDAYLEGETEILDRKFLVALWLRDWKAAASACRTGQHQDPWNYRFRQCELTLARHDTTRVVSPRWARAMVDSLTRMLPPEKAALSKRWYIPIYWRVVAATLTARAGEVRSARDSMRRAVDDAIRYGQLDNLAPDRAIFEWKYGQPDTAKALIAAYLRARPQQRDAMESDALLGPIVAAVNAEPTGNKPRRAARPP